MTEVDKEAKREYHRNWAKANRASRNASIRRWREKNPERTREIDRKCYTETKSKDRATRALQGAKWRAKSKGLPFDIDKSDIIIPTHCPVLPWIKIDWLTKDTGAQLDRIIPELGYVKGNVRVISGRANRLKSDASIEEVRAILSYLSGPRDSLAPRGGTRHSR